MSLTADAPSIFCGLTSTHLLAPSPLPHQDKIGMAPGPSFQPLTTNPGLLAPIPQQTNHHSSFSLTRSTFSVILINGSTYVRNAAALLSLFFSPVSFPVVQA